MPNRKIDLAPLVVADRMDLLAAQAELQAQSDHVFGQANPEDRQSAEDSAAAAAASEANAATSEAMAVASANAAQAASEASGNVLFYTSYADVAAALPGLSEGQVVEVFLDETRGGYRSRYRVESGVLEWKVTIRNGRANFDTLAALDADNTLTYANGGAYAGQAVVAGAFDFEVLPETDPNPHRTTAGGVKLKVLVGASGRAALAAFGMVGDGVTDDSAAFERAILSGLPLSGSPSAHYRFDNGVELIDPPSIDLDWMGGLYENDHPTARGIVIRYSFGTPITVTALDRPNNSVTVSSAASLSVGERVKLVSNDRCPGMRPSPAGVEEYQMAQTFTIGAILGNVVTFREAFEDRLTFLTSPLLLPIPKKRVQIKNGRMRCTPGFADSRTNGLLWIEGGGRHVVDIYAENSYGTMLHYVGCDGCAFIGRVENVGRVGDSSGSHGVSFTACVDMLFTGTAIACRHGVTVNAEPTDYTAQDFAKMGPSYRLRVAGAHVSGCSRSAISTHHGAWGVTLSDCQLEDSEYGFGLRGDDILVSNCRINRCEGSGFVYAEAGVAEADRTQRVLIEGCIATNAKEESVQVQKVNGITFGENLWLDNAPRGPNISDSTDVVFLGNNRFVSEATIRAGGNEGYMHIVASDIRNEGALIFDLENATFDGANHLIRQTSGEFTSYGRIVARASPSLGNGEIMRHLGASDAVHIEDLLYKGATGNPLNIAGSQSAKVRSIDGSYTYAYLSQSATANHHLNLSGSRHSQVAVLLLTSGGSFTLGSIEPAQYDGQRLLLRALDTVGSNIFTLDASVTGLDLRGGDLDMSDGDIYEFLWSGTNWVIESRTP